MAAVTAMDELRRPRPNTRKAGRSPAAVPVRIPGRIRRQLIATTGTAVAGGAAIGSLVLALWLLGRRAVTVAAGGGSWTSPRIVEAAACALGIVVAVWLAAAAVAGAVATFTAARPVSRAHRLAMTIAPTYVLRFYALAAGAGLALTTLAATAPPIPMAPAAPQAADVPLGLLRQPAQLDKALSPAAPIPAATPDAGGTPPPPSILLSGGPGLQPATAATTVVVEPGDSLWTLVAADLGPSASAADIAAAWPDWYELNVDVIGANPDLILPGQILQIPDRP